MPGLIRLGRTVTGRALELDPFLPRHTLLTGATRSGKSIQLYGMLTQLRGLPAKVCGVDPTGVLFNALGGALGGDDLRALTLRDLDKVESVVTGIVSEMDRRIGLLLDRRIDQFTMFTDTFPLLVVVFEEYPGMLAALAALDQASGARGANRVELRVRAAVQRMALEGAKVGLRVWIVAQRADASLLTGVLRSQLTQRLSFAQDIDGIRMLHEGITDEQIGEMQRFLPGMAFAEYTGELPLTRYRADLIDYPAAVGCIR